MMLCLVLPQVYMFDVLDVEASLDTLTFLSQLYEHTAPIRIGLLPLPRREDGLTGSDAGDLLVKIIYQMVEDRDGPYALQKLTQVTASTVAAAAAIVVRLRILSEIACCLLICPIL